MSGSFHTPAFKIFHYYYLCRVRAIHLVSDVTLEIFGIVTSGDKSVDRGSMNEWSDCQLTIAQMAELYDEGVSIILSEPEKSIIIYDILREHLANHKHNVEHSINMLTTPIEDLRKLDNLAGEVYKVAKQYRPMEEYTANSVLGRLDGINTARPMNKPRNSRAKVEEVPVVADIHTPIAQAIARQFYKRKQ